jgi:Fur family iron response transcriptional regulator
VTTANAHRPKSICLTPKEIEERLTAAGVQPTAQRIAICQFVLCEADHPSAEDVKAWADKNFPKLSLATVYNTLGTLVKAGLLREFRFPHTDKVLYDNNLEDHFHFLDEVTGQVIDLPREDVKVTHRLDQKMQNVTITGLDIVFRGQIKP